MDYPESWPQPSGLTAEGASLFATAYSSSVSKDDDWWAKAEVHTAELISSIQPVRLSEERRQAVTEFVQCLIQKCFDCQVVTFGSVPLKTYLPDGDIDLTALCFNTELKETWAQEVHSILRKADQNTDAEFRVRDVQYIHAEVKIIKCLVENIVVDISFNQTGGLCTLCFLEEVDRLIGQNHLFKRSIILVKAWCYYESRILGAHHGLISTYALETLVLYIFHVFHSSLRGPLEVLYTFLEYFSNFDWDKYCVSLWGPVPLSLLTEMAAVDVAEPPRKDGGNLLLTKEFLDACSETYAIAPAGQDNNQGRAFNPKFMNVLDPIRDTNNLGRSVNKANFSRIRKAFGYGARELRGVLNCSKDNISTEFEQFFACTFTSLKRYHSGGRPDTPGPSSRGSQKPITGGGSGTQKERMSAGHRQENGETPRYPQGSETYLAEAPRSQFQYPSWPGQMLTPRPQGGMDQSEWASYMTGNQNDPTMWIRAPTTMSDPAFFKGSGRDSGNAVNAVLSTSDSKQEKSRGTEPGVTRSVSGNLNVVGSEGQWRQVDGKGGSINQEGDKVRVQDRGSSYGTSQEKPTPVNGRSSDAYEHAVHTVTRDPMGGEYHEGEPSQEALRRASSMDDSAGKGVTQIRNAAGTSIYNTNYYMGGPPGFSGKVTSSNQGNLLGRNSSGDSSELSTFGRKSGSASVAEDDNTSNSKWVGNQSESTPSVDSSYQGVVQDQGSQSISQPLQSSLQIPAFLQIPPYAHLGQTHLGVSMPGSSSMAIPALSLPGPPPPPPPLSSHSTHPSSSLGEPAFSLGPRTNPYLALQFPRGPIPPPLPYLIPLVHQGDGAGSRMTSFPGEEQYWRSSHEEQLQPQKRPAVTTSAAPGGLSLPPLQIPDRSFSLGGAPLSTGSPSPFHLPPPMIGSGQLKLVALGDEHATETGVEFNPASHSSIDDYRQMDDSSQWQEGANSAGLNSRGRDNHQNGAEVVAASGKHLKATKEKRVSGRTKLGSDEDGMVVVRGGDGTAAENSVQWHGQPSMDEAPVSGVQAVPPPHVPVPTSAPFMYPNLMPTSLPPHLQSSSVPSASSEPPPGVPYHSLQLPPPNRTSVGTESAPSPTAPSQQPLPISVGVPVGPSSSFRPPVSDFASMSVGPSQRNRPMETTAVPPPPQYYNPNPFFLAMFPPYPNLYYLPPSMDGVGRGDSMVASHPNGSMEVGTDTLGSQVADDSRGRINLQVGMGVGERLKAAGIAISTSSKVETTNLEKFSEGVEPNDSRSDILSGDLEHHRYHLWRSCQIPRLASPTPYPSAKYSQGPRLWEGPGRPNVNMIPHMGLNSPHPLGGAAPSLHSPGRMAGANFQPRGFAGYGNEETSPKPRGGTGTYLPNLRHTYYNRERQAPGGGRGGSQHGSYGQQDRNERANEREGANQAHGPRYRGVGQGRGGQQSKHEPRAQTSTYGIGPTMSDQKSSASDRERNNNRPQQQQQQQQQPMERRGNSSQAPLGSLPSPTSPTMRAGLYPMPHINTNGKPGMGTTPPPTTPPVVMLYPAYDGTMVYSPEPLEFGSFGPVPFGAGQQAGGQMSGGRTSHEQAYVSGPPGSSSGLSSPPGERERERSQQPSSPQQR